jgi:Mg2+/Co2+ transporter CorC
VAVDEFGAVAGGVLADDVISALAAQRQAPAPTTD